jgi:hypothetical protein
MKATIRWEISWRFIFSENFFKILPIADWLKNKNAQESLLTQEMKPHN